MVQLVRDPAVNPFQPISRPCSIEKYPSSQMANRYTRIFDAGILFEADLITAIFSTRIKDAGIAIRHSRGYIISILQGLEMGWKGLPTGSRGPKIMKKGPKS